MREPTEPRLMNSLLEMMRSTEKHSVYVERFVLSENELKEIACDSRIVNWEKDSQEILKKYDDNLSGEGCEFEIKYNPNENELEFYIRLHNDTSVPDLPLKIDPANHVDLVLEMVVHACEKLLWMLFVTSKLPNFNV